MKRLYVLFSCLLAFVCSNAQPDKRSEHPFTDITLKLLYAIKTERDPQPLMDRLATVDKDSLIAELNNDQVRNAFWVNVYNAYAQVLLKQHPDWFNTAKLYKEKQVVIAGKKLSLGEVRDDLLRRFKGSFWSRIFKGSFKKQVAVDSLEARIHFTLNNGNEGDPAIGFYVPRRMPRMLDIMSDSYLQTHCKYYPIRDSIEIPMLLNTYMKDFGGKEQIYKMLEAAQVIPAGKRPVFIIAPVVAQRRTMAFFGE